MPKENLTAAQRAMSHISESFGKTTVTLETSGLQNPDEKCPYKRAMANGLCLLGTSHVIHIWHLQCKKFGNPDYWHFHLVLKDLYLKLDDIGDALIEKASTHLPDSILSEDGKSTQIAATVTGLWEYITCLDKLKELREKYNAEAVFVGEKDLALQNVYINLLDELDSAIYKLT